MDLEYAIVRLQAIADELQRLHDDLVNGVEFSPQSEHAATMMDMAATSARGAVESLTNVKALEEEREQEESLRRANL